MGYTDINIAMDASAAVSAGDLLEVSGSGTVGAAGAGTIKFAGVAFTDAASGDKVAVITEGEVELVSDGAIVAGALVIVTATGTNTVETIGAGTFDQAVGIALTTGVDTETLRVLLK